MNSPDKNALQIEKEPVMNQPTKTIAQSRTRPPVHPTRTMETWDDVDIHAESEKPWVRPSSLAAPPARPGFVQRWIRVGVKGEDDPTNEAHKLREGWKPRPAESVPASFTVPTIGHGRWAGCIGVGEMVLCERPEAMQQKRNEYYRSRTDRVTQGIESELQAQSDPRMRISQERKTNARRGVKAMDD